MSPDKRQTDRPDTFLIVEFRKLGEQNSYSLGITRNFSPEGLSLDSQNYDIDPGGILECTLKYPAADFSVSVTGVIVWKKEAWYKCMTGLKFIDMDEEVKGKIMDFMSSNMSALKPSIDSPYHEPLGAQNEAVKSPEVSAIKKDEISATDISVAKSDDLMSKISQHKQIRSPKNRRIHKEVSETSAQRKKIGLVIIAIAVLAFILAGIPFLMFDDPIKDIETITPSPEQGDNNFPLNQAENYQTGDISDKMPEADRVSTTPEPNNITQDTKMQIDTSIIKPDKQIIDSKQPRSETPTQLFKDKPVEKIPEYDQITKLAPKPEHSDSPVKNNVIASTAPPLPIINIPEKEVQSDPIKETGPVLETKGQIIPREVPAVKNDPPKPFKEQVSILDELFENNSRKWDIFNTNMAAARIDRGEYYIQNKRKIGAHIIFYNSDLDNYPNLMIDASIRLVKSSDNHSYGLVFGAKDTLNNYTVQINTDDFYSIRQTRAGVTRELTGGKIKSSVIKHNLPNTLKIVRQDNNIRFYINDTFIDEVLHLSFNGNNAGIIVDGESEIAIDRTRIKTAGD